MDDRIRHPRVLEMKARLEANAAARAERQAQRPKRTGATRFTTDYAIRWGRSQGYALIERESYDHRTRRHRDLEGGVDALFDPGPGETGRVGVQGAGVGERAAHWARFVEWGGPEKARRRGLRIAYVVFVRGSYEPVSVEWWA